MTLWFMYAWYIPTTKTPIRFFLSHSSSSKSKLDITHSSHEKMMVLWSEMTTNKWQIIIIIEIRSREAQERTNYELLLFLAEPAIATHFGTLSPRRAFRMFCSIVFRCNARLLRHFVSEARLEGQSGRTSKKAAICHVSLQFGVVLPESIWKTRLHTFGFSCSGSCACVCVLSI